MARVLSGVAILAAAASLLSGASPEKAAAQNIVGWTCMPTYGGCDEYGTPAFMANAVVGLPFEWRLVAKCNTGEWNLNAAVLNTGRLPPGLEIEPEYFRIVGVPTRAGSFSFQMLFQGISCPGASFLPYGDWTSEYTITVTGN